MNPHVRKHGLNVTSVLPLNSQAPKAKEKHIHLSLFQTQGAKRVSKTLNRGQTPSVRIIWEDLDERFASFLCIPFHLQLELELRLSTTLCAISALAGWPGGNHI